MGEVRGYKGGALTARILKTMSIFGSIQMLTIICSVVRTKLVAIWIGTAGVGIMSLLSSTMDLIGNITRLNTRQSSVRLISSSADPRVPCRAINRLSLILGLAGMILVAAMSPLLSRWAFGTTAHAWMFAVLAPTLVFSARSSARGAILQGLGNLRPLARVALWSAVVSTSISIPLFYFFRLHAIVPVLVIFPLVEVLMFYAQPAGVPSGRPGSCGDAMKQMVKLGVWLTAAMATTLGAEYGLRIFLSDAAGVDSVGRYQAGFAIINTYVGVIFTSITLEYFPRLAATVFRRRITRVVVSHQITVVTWVLLPLMIIIVSLDRLALQILYSPDFMAALPYITIAAAGVIPRGASWCFGYMIVARGDGRTYIFTELTSALVMLGGSIVLWNNYGYAGLGAAYVLQFVIYATVTWGVCRFRYGLRVPAPVMTLLILSTLTVALAVVLKHYAWWLPLLLLAVALPLSIKRLKLVSAIRSRRRRGVAGQK